MTRIPKRIGPDDPTNRVAFRKRHQSHQQPSTLLILTCNHHHLPSLARPSSQHLKKCKIPRHERTRRALPRRVPPLQSEGCGPTFGRQWINGEKEHRGRPRMWETRQVRRETSRRDSFHSTSSPLPPCLSLDPSSANPNHVASTHRFLFATHGATCRPPTSPPTPLPVVTTTRCRYLPRFKTRSSSAARCVRTSRTPAGALLLVLLGCEDTESEQQHAGGPRPTPAPPHGPAVAVQDDDERVGRGVGVYLLDAPVMRADGRATATSTSTELCWYSPSSCILRRKRRDEPHCSSRFPNLRSTRPSRCHPPIVNSRRPSPLTAFDSLPPRTKSPREGYTIATTVVAGFGRRRLRPLTHQSRNVASSS
ncbi:hypothetical protein GALMADRAFT_137532 [Galerina marginata CBS 339.88]|uniref:Uncharacterized protein n=1 Tax=Galerina marginata (strain CBS 339.88) TaxID=685588 RepID=A0A067TF16_GALM3|nr:hypothetical protein GALMADRAFT_137532 [Galerina marginata CBS 339.88]